MKKHATKTSARQSPTVLRTETVRRLTTPQMATVVGGTSGPNCIGSSDECETHTSTRQP